MPKRKTWTGRVYTGRDPETGKQTFEWVGRFDTKRERDRAVAARRVELEAEDSSDLPACDEYVDRYLAAYRRREDIKDSTADIQAERLRRFRADFAGRPLDISRAEIKDWMNGEGKWSGSEPVPNGYLPAVAALYNYAIDEDDLALERNPARKLAKRGKGRSEEPPPTPEEFDRLLDACSTLGDYADEIRALFKFAAFTLMRPSELYGLEWQDVDFTAMRIQKRRRVYRGKLDKPKTGEREIALTPPARDAIMNLPRVDDLVFHSVTGKRLAASGMSGTWARVQAAAGLSFDFYHATKHYGVWFMWTKLEMSDRVIAAQAGWKPSTVTKMLETYGHGEVGALEDVDAAFADHAPVLRIVGGSDA